MGLAHSAFPNCKYTACEPPKFPYNSEKEPSFAQSPPRASKVETFDEKVYRKFREQPLVPIGCAATAYFLISGIKSFRDRDPIKSQRMMKYRVGAQFVTLLCFMGYVGLDNFDFRLAPMYQDAHTVQRTGKEEQEDKGAHQ